ncbi:MAG: Ldh family oxidoreductase [Lachnospiraceae bacterium]
MWYDRKRKVAARTRKEKPPETFDTKQKSKEDTDMTETRPFVSWELVGDFMTAAFKAAGVPDGDAEICTDVLLESDRRGIESHGSNRFKPIYIDRIRAGILNPVTEYEILKETPTTLVADAHDGMGMVASYRMMEALIKKAKLYGLSMGAIQNSSHYGIAGYWPMMAAKEGLLGITGTNARASIVPRLRRPLAWRT